MTMFAEDAPLATVDDSPPRWWYWGGPRAEHSTKPEVKTSPYSVTQGYRWCARAVLPPTEAALLNALFVRVDAKTWRWPPKPGERGGSSLFELAEAIGKSERHTRRTLRKLEARGVLITYDCRPNRNEYQIVPEVLKELGEAGHEAVRKAVKERRSLEAAQQADADAKLDDNPAPKAAGQGDPLPRWARRVSTKRGMTPELAASLVRTVWRAAGEQGLWLHEGCNLRRVLKVWRNLDEPSLEEWEALMQGISRAAAGGQLRGLLGRGWRWSTRAVLKLAEQARVREIVRQMTEQTPPKPDTPPSGEGASQPGARLLPGPASPTGPPITDQAEWASQLTLLKRRSDAMGAIWLPMVQYVGVDEAGVTELRVPFSGAADNLEALFGDALALISNGPVRLVWG